MPAPLATFGFDVSFASEPDGTWAEIGFDVTPAGDGALGFDVTPIAGLDIALCGSPSGATDPNAAVVQDLFLAVTRSGGGSLAGQDLVGDAEVTQSEEQMTAQLAVKAWESADDTDEFTKGPFGFETDFFGAAPPGTETLAITMAMRALSGESATFTLASNLRSLDSGRDLIRAKDDDAAILELTAEGLLAQWEAEEVSLSLAYDHGLTHGEIAKLAATGMGIPAASIDIPSSAGWPLVSPIQFVCRPGIAFMRQILDAAGWKLTDSREGRIEAYPLAPVDAEPAESIGLHQIETGQVRARAKGVDPRSVPRCITVIGQVATPPTGSGWHTEEQRVIVSKEFAVGSTTLTQDSAGVISGSLTTPPPTLQKFSETVNRQIFFEGCLQATEVEVWGYKARKTYRYQAALVLSPDGKPYRYNDQVFFYDENVVKDDQVEAFADASERWALISFQRQERIYDGLEGRQGFLIQSTDNKGEWRFDPIDLKSRTGAGTTWESVNVASGVRFRGNGTPVSDGTLGKSFDTERLFIGPKLPDDVAAVVGSPAHPYPLETAPTPLYLDQWSESTVEDFELDECKYISSSSATRYLWRRLPGILHYFADGSTSSQGTIDGDQAEVVTTTHSTAGENSHDEIVTRVNLDSGEVESTRRSGIPGSLPEAEECSPELQALENTTHIEHKLSLSQDDPPLFTGRPAELTYEWGIETPDQAQFRADLEYRMLTAPTVQISRPFAVLDVGSPASIEIPNQINPADYPHPSNAQLMESKTSIPALEGNRRPIVTVATYRLFVK